MKLISEFVENDLNFLVEADKKNWKEELQNTRHIRTSRKKES